MNDQVARLDTLDDDIAGVTTYITPNDRFYRIDTALAVPQVDPAGWSLRITGLVDDPYELTFDEILAMDLSDYVITLSCVSNPVGGSLVGNAVWTGVPLAVLLQRAGVQRGAQQIVGRSVDDFTAGFPTTAAYDGRNAILAVGMNDDVLPTRHGFPARLVVAGLYGYVSAVKWLEEIHLTTWDGFDGYWVPRGWSKRGPMKTQSRIDVPNARSRLTAGQTTSIAGVAGPPREASSGWKCRLTARTGSRANSARHWATRRGCSGTGSGPPPRGRHTITVRATDGTGTLQSRGPKRVAPDGAEGWHTVTADVSP